MSFQDHLKDLPDPRINRSKHHELCDILVISICTLLCGGESFYVMENFGNTKKEWFATFLRLPNGIPSHDTFNRLFSLLVPVAFGECFIRWTEGLRKTIHQEIVSLDGKAAPRATCAAAHGLRSASARYPAASRDEPAHPGENQKAWYQEQTAPCIMGSCTPPQAPRFLDASALEFLLPGHGRGFIGRGMKFRLLSAACVPLLLAACEKKMEVTITETRPVTTRDTPPKLNATDDERFLDARPAQAPGADPVKAEAPAAWQKLPSTPFRILNYRFGTSGEVWVSLSAGSLADNVNRWLRQFGAAPLEDAGISALRKVEIAGAQGAWVETEGHYEPGMGQPGKEDQALAGVIAQIGGRIVTVKMVGPKTEVAEQKAALETFAKSLKLAE